METPSQGLGFFLEEGHAFWKQDKEMAAILEFYTGNGLKMAAKIQNGCQIEITFLDI